MKFVKLITPAMLFLALFISSCSIQKRQYMPGYSIEWNKKKSEVVPKDKGEADKPGLAITETHDKTKAQDNASASIDKQISVSNVKESSTPVELDAIHHNTPTKPETFKSGFKKGLKLLKPVSEGPKANGFAIASLVLGILSLITYTAAIAFAILAIIFGFIALKRIRNNPDSFKGRGMALAGLICGIVAIAIWFAIIMAA
jgi:hypothetical protein